MLTVDFDRLGLVRGERLLDLGAGGGRHAFEAMRRGARVTALDYSAADLKDAVAVAGAMLAGNEVGEEVWAGAVNGDALQLPFADNTFDKAWSLDVLEHLSLDALQEMLAEANRVLKPGGALFVYTHVRKNAPIAAGLKWINQAAKQLERWDLIDLRQEHLRKSDHLNPLQDIPHLERGMRNW